MINSWRVTAIFLLFTSVTFGQSIYVDGNMYPSPQAIFNSNLATANGTRIRWAQAPTGSTINVSTNPFGNTSVQAAPSVTLTTSCGGKTV